jgi:glucan phosphoethanolaminetransferase (alkaline phosphatase superfamily)
MSELAVDQNQKSQSRLMLFNSEVGQAPLASVQKKANDLWATLAEKDTGTVYQQAAAKTWKLLKQTIALIFFLWVLLAALIIWIWGIGFRSGLQFRTWLEVKQPTLDELISTILQVFFVWPFKWAVAWANEFVKKYLGWEIEFDPIKPKPTSEKPAATPSESTETKSLETTEPPSKS